MECLLRAMLLQAFSSLRSGRPLMERLDTDLLFRRFADRAATSALRDGARES